MRCVGVEMSRVGKITIDSIRSIMIGGSLAALLSMTVFVHPSYALVPELLDRTEKVIANPTAPLRLIPSLLPGHASSPIQTPSQPSRPTAPRSTPSSVASSETPAKARARSSRTAATVSTSHTVTPGVASFLATFFTQPDRMQHVHSIMLAMANQFGTLNAARTTPSSGDVKPIESQGLLQRSPQGWKLFGIVWYWWVIGAAIVGKVLHDRNLITMKWPIA